MINPATIMAVVSGKGGVGKSLMTVNLAEALADAGHRVAIVDLDFGQAGCGVLLNEVPPACVLDVALHTAPPAAAYHTTATGLTLVEAVTQAASAEGHAARLFATLSALLRHLQHTHDYVLLDTPAGIDGPVRWALEQADLGLLVLVGEPTAISATYGLAKLTWQQHPGFPLGTIVNFADTEAEALSVHHRFADITEKFTGNAPFYLGWGPFSREIRRSVQAQQPFFRTPGPPRQALAQLAHTLIEGSWAHSHTAAP